MASIASQVPDNGIHRVRPVPGVTLLGDVVERFALTAEELSATILAGTLPGVRANGEFFITPKDLGKYLRHRRLAPFHA